jgi:hypothetical protein
MDSFQDVYVTKQTASADFPTTAGAFQTTARGLTNAPQSHSVI